MIVSGACIKDTNIPTPSLKDFKKLGDALTYVAGW